MADITIPPEIISRKEAKARGLKFYFTDKPCKRGHIAKRRCPGGSCLDCESITGPLWSAAHRSQVAVTTARWRVRNPDYGATYSRAWRERNPEKAKEQIENWRKNNYERVRAHARAVYRRNPDKYKAKVAVWGLAFPEKKRALATKRRARLLGADGQHTGAELAALFERQGKRCIYCRKKLTRDYCADHIVPLSRGGSNWITNIQLTCRSCNSRKNAKDPIRFAKEWGRLL